MAGKEVISLNQNVQQNRAKYSWVGVVVLSAFVLSGIVPAILAASPPNYVTVTFTPAGTNNATQNTLTITGDTGPNYITVTWANNAVTVTGAYGTQIITQAGNVTSTTLHTSSNFVINANMNAGDDYVILTTLPNINVTSNLGDGNDTLKLLYSSVGTLTVDGSTGTNTVAILTSRVRTQSLSNIQYVLP